MSPANVNRFVCKGDEVKIIHIIETNFGLERVKLLFHFLRQPHRLELECKFNVKYRNNHSVTQKSEEENRRHEEQKITKEEIRT
jgi:hypothetical protein